MGQTVVEIPRPGLASDRAMTVQERLETALRDCLAQQHADAAIELIRGLPTAGSKIEEVLAYVGRVVAGQGHQGRSLRAGVGLSRPR